MESISKQRLELDSPNLNAHDTRFSYQDIIALAKFTVAVKIESVNKVTDMAVSFITKMAKITEPDEYMTTALESNVDPDDYMRFRLARRFERIAQGLYEAVHKPKEETDVAIVKMFGEQLDKYEDTLEKTGSAEEAKLALLADQMGVD